MCWTAINVEQRIIHCMLSDQSHELAERAATNAMQQRDDSYANYDINNVGYTRTQQNKQYM